MAQVVAGIGVPHTPVFAATVDPDDMTNETARFYRTISRQLDESRLDALLIFSTDHLNTFFLDNYPALAIGVASHTSGPNDGTVGLRNVSLRVPESFAAHIRDCLTLADYDVATTQKFDLDHSWLVPLQFVRPDGDIPIVPIFINGHLPPLSSSQRAYEMGRVIRSAVEEWPEEWRVGIMGSGSFSLDVGGFGVFPERTFGVPDPEWAAEVSRFLSLGDFDGLVSAATREQMAAAGNVGGELLDWIAMLGAIDVGPPDSLDIQMQLGHGYAYWRLS